MLYQLNTEAQFRGVVRFPAYRIPPPNEPIVEPYLLDHSRVIGGS